MGVTTLSTWSSLDSLGASFVCIYKYNIINIFGGSQWDIVTCDDHLHKGNLNFMGAQNPEQESGALQPKSNNFIKQIFCRSFSSTIT